MVAPCGCDGSGDDAPGQDVAALRCRLDGNPPRPRESRRRASSDETRTPMARYRYNSQIDPPGPFVLLSIRRPRSTGLDPQLLPAQVDTAADFTVVPWAEIAQLQLVPVDEILVQGFESDPAEYPRYLVDVAIQGSTDRVIVPVLAAQNEPYVLLGRDVLNCFRIVLDGPNRALDIE